MNNNKLAAFSLVEVTLALGVAGFCLLAVFALLPIGVKTNQTSFSQTAAATILSDVVADMRTVPKSYDNAQTYSVGASVWSAGLCYTAITVTTGHSPPNAAYWSSGFVCSQYAISFTDRTDRYFDSEGRCSCDQAGTQKLSSNGTCSDTWNPAIQPRYHVVIKFPSATTNASCARVVITWPAIANIVDPAATDAPAAGSIETVAAFDRL